MLDDIFKLSSDFLKTFNKPYRRYFLDKYPLTRQNHSNDPKNIINEQR